MMQIECSWAYCAGQTDGRTDRHCDTLSSYRSQKLDNLGAVEGEKTEHLHLLDCEDGASFGNVQQLHSSLVKSKLIVRMIIADQMKPTFPYSLSEMTNSSHEVNESKKNKYASLIILNQGDFNCELIFIREHFICNFSDTMT